MTIDIPARLFPLRSRHGPQLILEPLDVLLLDRNQLLPMREEIEIHRRQVASLSGKEIGDRVVVMRLDVVRRLRRVSIEMGKGE